MIIYPAIDLRNGHCVRLYQGDYNKETVYANDPLQIANDFIQQGAEWLHVVDLDGAKDPSASQAKTIVNIANNTNIKIQTGGGIRNEPQIQYLLDNNIERVIIGSLAVKAPEQVAEWFVKFGPQRIVLALDIHFDEKQQAMVAVNAWQSTSQQSLFEVIRYYKTVGLKHILCTDITRDGTLTGPNFNLYADIQRQYPDLQVQASGGIHALEDLNRLRQQKTSGVIVGRALYENKFTLKEALAC